jgi:hypothetical protein
MPNISYPDSFIPFPRNFDEWLLTFKRFVIKNKRFPLSGKNGYEGHLYRWFFNANKLVDLSAQEIIEMDSLKKELSLYPHDSAECAFYDNCLLYQKFVEQNKRLITYEDDMTLYRWFNKAIKDCKLYKDNRANYFRSLIKTIATYCDIIV